MILYLSDEEVIEINRLNLQSSGEINDFSIRQYDDIRFIIEFAEHQNEFDMYEKALAYCISLIVLHPFADGNHRTSLHAAELFLIKNGYLPLMPDKESSTVASDKNRLLLQKWRLEFEEEHELERYFFSIATNDIKALRIEGIINVMNSEYGIGIKKWLVENYLKNPI